MIIDPDFLDHWRTRMVVDALGDELAPVYIMRLWSHCQHRKADRFEMPPAGLKAQCRYPGDAAAFELALSEAGFVKREGDSVHVLGWAEQNAALLAAWDNGAKGGRPRKPEVNPRVLDEGEEKPVGNPTVTQGEPKANPDETDKRRVDKKTPSTEGGDARTRATPRPEDVDEQTWGDWKQLRKGHKAQASETAVAEARREAAKAGMTLERFLQIWCLRGSRGLQAEWLKPHERNHTAGDPAWRTEQRQRTQLAAPGVAVKDHQDAAQFFDVEARDVTPRALG